MYIDLLKLRKFCTVSKMESYISEWKNLKLTNVNGTPSHWTFELSDQLVSIQSYLDDIVQKCKQRCQRKCSNKYGNKAILDD